MCGFAGVAGCHESPEKMASILKGMGSALSHRGPDDSGIWQISEFGLGLAHQRLSIVDLKGRSRQPMASRSGRYVIAYNGEIYNFRDLRRTLEASGKRFRTTSDTEVLLEAIDKWGIQSALHRCVGMFAFALVDLEDRTLYLVRDRIGEKPLYYGYQGDLFLFGSELRALRAHPEWRGEMSTNAADAMLRLGYVPAPYSIYQDISKLEPGCLVSLQFGNGASRPLKSERWWSYSELFQSPSKPLTRLSQREFQEEFEDLFGATIADHSMADVSVGGFLSGGVDSSLVLAEMQRQSPRPIKSFTIGFEETSYDESPYAHAVAENIGTDHQRRILTARDAQEVIPQIPEIFDEPFADSSQIPTILLSRLASETVKVVVSGDGGDEMFGGYNRYLWGPRLSAFNSIFPLSSRKLVASGFERLGLLFSGRAEDAIFGLAPDGLATRQLSEKLRKLSDVLRAVDNVDLYKELVQQKVPTAVASSQDISSWRKILDGQKFADSGIKFDQRMMILDSVTFLPDDILVKVDRASMSSGLEVRAPLLDYRIVEFASRLPLGAKIKGGKGKVLLRGALAKRLDQHLMNRPKAGFALPIGRWMKGPLRTWVDSVLDRNHIANTGILDPQEVDTLWKGFCRGENNNFLAIWHILMFQAWYQTYERKS